jgi:hypothetical protein
MKKSAFLAALMASVAFGPFPADAKSKLDAAAATTIQFQMHVSAGAAKCLPKAIGYVSDHTIGPVEYLSVYVTGLPPNTDFDFFVIQVPIAPFGLSWYQGDIETDAKGNGSGFFIGRFNIETFIISPGAVPSADIFHSPPAVVAQSKTGANTNGPVQIYHLGLWFNNAADANKAGCPKTETPFNGEHDAGIQVLNTAEFTGLGPLSGLQ